MEKTSHPSHSIKTTPVQTSPHDHAEQIVYLNGQFIPRHEAKIDIEDRGFTFGDGVYEMMRYDAGRALLIEDHIARLTHSLSEIQLVAPPELGQLQLISDELVRRNHLTHAKVYWQITRGSAPRNHLIPEGLTPTVMAIAHSIHDIQTQVAPNEVAAILAPDLRWSRCDIKSIMLLPNILAKTQAHRQGADEAIFHRDGYITEGSSTSVLMVRQGALVTHPTDHWILPSLRRKNILKLARQNGIPTMEQLVTIEDFFKMDEIMIAGATRLMDAVTKLDHRPIGQGHTGPVTQTIFRALREEILQTRPH